MIDVRELMVGVTLDEGFDPGSLVYNERLGFLQVAEADVAVGGMRLLGFGAPLDQTGYIYETDVTPLTEFADLPPEHRGIEKQGKGVGPRMYNVHEALGGLEPAPDSVGAYVFDIDPRRILDMRSKQGNDLQRVLRHGGRMINAQLRTVEAVASGIHRSYDGAYAKLTGDERARPDAVLLEVPPLPTLRRRVHGVSGPEGVKPQFTIIRNSAITLRRIGSTTLAW